MRTLSKFNSLDNIDSQMQVRGSYTTRDKDLQNLLANEESEIPLSKKQSLPIPMESNHPMTSEMVKDKIPFYRGDMQHRSYDSLMVIDSLEYLTV